MFSSTVSIYIICHSFKVYMIIYYTNGFWPRVRARALRAPVFLGSLPCQTGRCAPSAHRIFAASYSSAKKYIFTIFKNKILQVRARAARVECLLNITFHAPRPSCRTLLSYAVLYPTKRSYAAHCWAMLHPTELCCILLGYDAPY